MLALEYLERAPTIDPKNDSEIICHHLFICAIEMQIISLTTF